MEFIWVSEESSKDVRNILKKIYEGLKVTKQALQWQDDIYLTRELNAKSVPYYAEGDLEQAIFRHHGSYKTQIVNTALRVTESVPFFDVHTPIYYEIEGFKKMLREYPWEKKLLIKTLYSHCVGVEPYPYVDVKIHGPHSKEEILQRIGQSLFFSTSPQSISHTMVEILESFYPNQSKYES